MNQYVIRPEVSGELGPLTEMDTSTHPPAVTRLNYEFSGWMGDDIVETFPAYIVTATLAEAIGTSRLSGVRIDDVIVTKNPQFEEFFPDIALSLPHWYWLRPVGDPHESDFWQDEAGRLVVSESALSVLRRFHISNAEVTAL